MSDTELLIKTLLHQARLHNKQGASGLGLLFTNAAQEIEKLQAENAELKKQSKWISVDITDVKIGSTLTYRNSKESIVYDISDIITDGINGGVSQCRIWANVIGGKGVYHTYRKDGFSHYEAAYDIVKITPPEGE